MKLKPEKIADADFNALMERFKQVLGEQCRRCARQQSPVAIGCAPGRP